MLQQNHIKTIRQTHRTITTILPLVTAALTVTGALIASMDRSGERDERDGMSAQQTRTTANDGFFGGSSQGSAYGPTLDDENEFSLLAYARTLVSRVLLVALGFALVGALAFVALRVGSVGVAIELTALILLTLYLAEKVTRRARRQARLIRRGRSANRADRMRQAAHTTQAAHADTTSQASQPAAQPTAA